MLKSVGTTLLVCAAFGCNPSSGLHGPGAPDFTSPSTPPQPPLAGRGDGDVAIGPILPQCAAAGAPAGALFPSIPPPMSAPPIGFSSSDIAVSNHLTGPATSAGVAPPPITGGTLLATRDGTQLVASDPDRDLIYFIDTSTKTLSHTIQLQPGDVPGRLAEDGAGRIHVVLRNAHALASLTRDPQTSVTRRNVCDLPRGVAYDPTHDTLRVACAEGKLLTVPTDPTGATANTVSIARDARDVIVRNDQVFVTQFRSAQLLQLNADGSTRGYVPPTFSRSVFDPCGTGGTTADSTPTTAWRAVVVPGQGVAMLHQRARTDEIKISVPGGYGGGATSDACSQGIVQSSLTLNLDGAAASIDLPNAALPVDLAVDPDGVLLAIATPGNWGMSGQLQMVAVSDVTMFAQLGNNGSSSKPLCMDTMRPLPDPAGQATALTFASPYILAVQQREPAAISFIDTRTSELTSTLDLKQPSRADTGHAMFHVRTGAGIACASCHPEAGDDSHVWTFETIGARRTQTVRGGILGTEPFHWNGDMQDFNQLEHVVFEGRMSGFSAAQDQVNALASWLDRQPALSAHADDAAAAARGKTLFESAAVGCTNCHNGAHLTNNQTVDVGTGAALQVPSLHGVSFRLPLLHNGCALSLRDRFGTCGGGDSHGHTSQLGSNDINDLTSYLETL